jgi:ligand-binding SRPBCC domain-containing protein
MSGAMRERIFTAELWLPRKRGEVFAFFSAAENLQAITPPWLEFQILSPPPIVMRTGTLLDYRLKIHGWPVKWRTEITAWEPPVRFVDEQRRGPYRQWIHEHRFVEQDGGTLATDLVRYAVTGGILVDNLFVRRDIEGIFRFRREKLRELLG